MPHPWVVNRTRRKEIEQGYRKRDPSTVHPVPAAPKTVFCRFWQPPSSMAAKISSHKYPKIWMDIFGHCHPAALAAPGGVGRGTIVAGRFHRYGPEWRYSDDLMRECALRHLPGGRSTAPLRQERALTYPGGGLGAPSTALDIRQAEVEKVGISLGQPSFQLGIKLLFFER